MKPTSQQRQKLRKDIRRLVEANGWIVFVEELEAVCDILSLRYHLFSLLWQKRADLVRKTRFDKPR